MPISVPGKLSRCFSVAFCLLLFLNSAMPGSDIFILKDDTEPSQLGTYIEYLEDPEGRLSISEVSSAAFAERFNHSNKKTPNFGYTDSAYWVRFHIKNQSNLAVWLILLDNTTMQYVDFFRPSKDGLFTAIKTGVLRPVDSRDLNHHKFIFRMIVPKDAEQTYYMRLKSADTINIPLTLFSMSSFSKASRMEYLRYGLLYGMLLFMLAFYCLLWVYFKESHFIYYAIFILSLILYLATIEGITHKYVWPDKLWWVAIAGPVFLGFLIISFLKFTDSFLLLKEYLGPKVKISTAIQALTMLVILATPISGYSVSLKILIFMILMALTYAMVSGIYVLKKSFRVARFYMAAWIIPTAGILTTILIRLRVLPSTSFTENFMQFGFLWLILLLAMALADRFNLLRIEAEQASHDLVESEERYRSIVEYTHEGMIVTGNDYRFQFVNNEFCRLLEYSRDEIIGQDFRKFLDKESLNLVSDRYVRRQRGEAVPPRYEFNIVRKSGEKRRVEISSTVYKNSDGTMQTIALLLDISERKRAEAALVRLQNLLENIINSMPSILIGVDKGGIIILWNNEARTKTGITAGEASGRYLKDVYPSLPVEQEKIDRAIRSRKPLRYERRATKEKGRTFYTDITVFPLITDGIEGAVIRMDDVTDQEKKEQQLRQAQKMEIVGNLAVGLAHDFNNALGGVIGPISLVQERLKRKKKIDRDELANLLLTMEQASNLAVNMVQQLLAFSRKTELQFVPTDLRDIIYSVLKFCQNTFDKSVTIEVRTNDTPAKVHGDPAMIEQAFLNLAINAMHAMTTMRASKTKWGGNLVIGLKKIEVDEAFREIHPEAQSNRYWCISMEDNGVGIKKAAISKIFDPFFTTKPVGTGTGMGLPMVYSIIMQHNGFINVYSEPGKGSNFLIYLPAHDGQSGSPRELDTALSEEIKREGLVLVVEDNPIMAKIARKILEELGLEVIIAVDGERGMAVYQDRNYKFDLVLLDMQMPKKSGQEVFYEMKKLNPKVKVLLTSGFRNDARVDELIAAGVEGFIEKPFTFEQLKTRILKIIG